MTGLMILMTKAGFAVPHRYFFPTCMLTAYFFLSFEPTGLAIAITGHHRLNFSLFFLFFFCHWRPGCPKRTN